MCTYIGYACAAKLYKYIHFKYAYACIKHAYAYTTRSSNPTNNTKTSKTRNLATYHASKMNPTQS